MDTKRLKGAKSLNEQAQEIYNNKVLELTGMGYTTRQAKRLLQKEARSILKQRRKGGQR